MANTTLVPAASSHDMREQLSPAGHSSFIDTAREPPETTPAEKNETWSVSCFGKTFKDRGLSEETQAILLSSWRDSTKKQYRSYLKKWVSFCDKRKINFFEANVTNVLSFLTELYQCGLGYSCLNTARSALSSFLLFDNDLNIGTHPLVRRFLKGVFILRPALPRYNVTWDVNIVLDYLKSLSPLASLSLLQLSQKLLMLLAILSGQRGQTLHLIDIRNIHILETSVKIVNGDLLKTSNPRSHLGELNFSNYEIDTDLCIVRTISYYLQRTEQLRGSHTRLFNTTQRPYKPVSRDTIGRWLKTIMQKSGIDVTIFKPHSTRAASTSAARGLKIPVDTILRTVGWSKDSVFRKYYSKPISMNATMSEKLLEKFK